MEQTIHKYAIKPIVLAIIVWEVVFWSLFFSLFFYLTDNVVAFRIENKAFLWLFLVIPVLIIGFILSLIWKNKAIKKLSDQKLTPFLIHPISTLKTYIKFFLLRNAIAFLVIALLNPQYGKGKQKATSEGIEIMIGLDISNSMRALDLDQNKDRLKIAKMSIERLLNNLHGDKVGVVIFAGNAFVQVPLTSDYGTVKMFLSSVTPDMMSNQGTSIGLAIDKAMMSFDFENGVNKTIIIMSDGEDFEGDALTAAKNALDKNVIINTIGMGTNKGTVIPDFKNGKRIGLKKDESGNTVITHLNENMLKHIAESGGGNYSRAKGTFVNFDGLLERIKKINKSEIESNLYTDYQDQFQWFIGIGLLFLISHFLFTSKRSGFIHKLQDYEV